MPALLVFQFQAARRAAVRFSGNSQAGEHIEAKTTAEELAETWRSAIRAGTFRRRRGNMPPTVPAPTLDSITLERFGAIYAERLGKPVSENHQACFRQFIAFTAPSTDTTYGARPLIAFTRMMSRCSVAPPGEGLRGSHAEQIRAAGEGAVPMGDEKGIPRAQSNRGLRDLKRESTRNGIVGSTSTKRRSCSRTPGRICSG